jgi:predicted nucleic acid-binding protein
VGVRRIVNTSPIILLSKANCLDLLRVDADEVIIPEAVLDEVRAHEGDLTTRRTVEAAAWLTTVANPPIPELVHTWKLGAGESAVLALALGSVPCEVVLDDLPARRHATAHGIPVRGTVGIVLLCRQSGVIPAARPVLDRLRQSGLYLTDILADQILALVGEKDA